MTAPLPPLVSFVVPVRNDAARLARCLASIRAQTGDAARLDVVVVDDGSTDGSATIAEACGARVRRGRGGRIAALRNQGASMAAGSLIAFVDADHEIDPGWLAAAVDALNATGAAAAGAPYSPPAGAGWVEMTYDALRTRSSARRDTEWLASGNMVVRRAAFESVRGFDVTLRTCEDVDFCRRLRSEGHRIVAEPGMRSVHHGDPTTLSGVFLGELWRGRDNLRVSLRAPRSARSLITAAIPLLELAAIPLIAAGLVAPRTATAAAVVLGVSIPAVLVAARAARMAQRHRAGIAGAIQALLVAAAYDAGRALAIVAGASYGSRRPAAGVS